MKESNGTKDIQCCRADIPLSDAQLKEIANLIYDTDLHIYPAMFRTKQEAEVVIPKMIRAGDKMFRPENMFIAMKGTEIIGVLIWIRGPLQWDKRIFEKCGGRAEYINRLAIEYFSLFDEASTDMASMVRISVKKELHGKHIGSLLMDTFINAETGPYQLFVLANNEEALPFFQEKGFVIRETRPGFSLDNQPLPCFWMVKRA